MLAIGLIGYAAAPHEVMVVFSLFVAGIGFLLGDDQQQSAASSRREHAGPRDGAMEHAFLGSRPLAGLIDGAVADLTSPRLGVLDAVAPLVIGWWALHRVGLVDRDDLPLDPPV